MIYSLPDANRQPEFYDGVPTKRLIAWIIDSILILILTLAVLPFTLFLGIFFFIPFYFALGFAYRTVTLARYSSTLGMAFLAMEIRHVDGTRLSLQTAALHTLGYSISMVFPVIQLASIVLMLTSSQGQGLSDQLLGTAALNRRK
jgi:uncharacterized RDD family membrane protein YckC